MNLVHVNFDPPRSNERRKWGFKIKNKLNKVLTISTIIEIKMSY